MTPRYLPKKRMDLIRVTELQTISLPIQDVVCKLSDVSELERLVIDFIIALPSRRRC